MFMYSCNACFNFFTYMYFVVLQGDQSLGLGCDKSRKVKTFPKIVFSHRTENSLKLF